MNNQLFIPTKIKVGYNMRSDTYTDLLGYVIYYDEKGKLRKETSWRGWIDKGIPKAETRRFYDYSTGQYVEKRIEARDPLPTHDYENLPTEGFILNKRVGGGSGYSSWHQRDTKCRVWDPRGFEIEIDIPNLLFILQENNSIKGKGLEGQFVYAWEGKDLVLLPVTSQEYQNSIKFTELRSKKVSAKELVPGYTYQTKEQEILIYLGKFDCVTKPYEWREEVRFGKYFVFVDKKGKNVLLDKTSSIANVVSDTVIDTFADFIDNFKNSDDSSYINELIETSVKYNKSSNTGYYYSDDYMKLNLYDTPCVKDGDGEYTQYGLYPVIKMDSTGYYSWDQKFHTSGFKIVPIKKIFFSDGMLTEKKLIRKTSVENTPTSSIEETNKMKFVALFIKRNNSKKRLKLNA
jgi:hypothetical protein